MWQWTLNWNEIRSDMVIGSCPISAADIGTLVEATGVNALLSLQSDECRGALNVDYDEQYAAVENLGVMMINTPMLDFNPPDQRRHLPEAVRALTALLASDRKVYIHCTAGRNRAPLVAMAYLSFVEMNDPHEALEMIQKSRPESDPSWEAYWGCRADLMDKLRPHVHVRSYYLAQAHPNADPERNWYHAEMDVIRQSFVSPRSLPEPRLDPNRP